MKLKIGPRHYFGLKETERSQIRVMWIGSFCYKGSHWDYWQTFRKVKEIWVFVILCWQFVSSNLF